MTGCPIRQALRPAGFDIGVIGRPQGGDKYLRCAHLAGLGANDIHGLARVIDKQAFTGGMTLAHHRRQLAFPAGVELAVPAVAIPIRVNPAILLPQQRERYTLAPQLGMYIGPIRLRNSTTCLTAGIGKQTALKLRIRQIGWQRPAQPLDISAAEILRYRRAANSQALRHLTS